MIEMFSGMDKIKMDMQVTNNLISLAADNLGAMPQNRAKKTGESQAVKLDADFGKLIEKANAPIDDQAAVEAARKALQSGQLETPEAFAAAAESLLSLGI
jgi:hypothetical protein